jgi:pyruvate dehydrogenase E2 component (dihydrolipoamide acetyltransferase)
MAAERQVSVPDIADFEEVDVIEVLVAPGDRVVAEQSLITLESEKATMEIPSPCAGVVKALHVAVGDKVSEGSRILLLEVSDEDAVAEPEPAAASRTAAPQPATAAAPAAEDEPVPPEAGPAQMLAGAPPLAQKPAPGVIKAHASPSVRRLARELGVDLARVPGSGRKGRILQEDVQRYVKQALASGTQPPGPTGFAVPEMPEIDFSRWGEIELQPLNKLRRVSARNVHRAWLTVPHVTQFDEADITELEEFRREKQPEAKQRSVKLTPLGFLMKAVAVVLQDFPNFNASLDRSGEALVIKKYIHIGIAVDTEMGLVVPVVRDVDKKGLFELAGELAALSQKARDRKLRPEDLAGGTFSISSLGGIGGTAFTPIVNAPEVAILGVARARMQPVYVEGTFQPRLMLPLCLSYDHRVIDGADAVRFTSRLKAILSDIRNLLL